MTEKEILDTTKKLVKGVKYKPGFYLAAGEMLGGILLKLGIEVKDIATHYKMPIGRDFLLKWDQLKRAKDKAELELIVAKQIRDLVIEGEAHEACEYLTFDGVKRFDPHTKKENLNG
jgi:hypothetical protein